MSEELAVPLKSMGDGDGDRDGVDVGEEKDERGSSVFCGDGSENDRSSNSCLIFLLI